MDVAPVTIPVISLFCGCGGFDQGFKQEGFSPVLALDISAAAVSTYNHNHGVGIAQEADLAMVSGAALIALIEARRPMIVPRGVIGGPPCQTFSRGNRSNDSNDPRLSLPSSYAGLLKVLNARYDLDFFVFENVPGIGYSKHQERFLMFKKQFDDAGFTIHEQLLDAVGFGVPQIRPRMFVVGLNKARFPDPTFTFPQPTFVAPKTVKSAIYGLCDPTFYARGLTKASEPRPPNHWTMLPRSAKFTNGSLGESHTRWRSFRVLAWDRPSWTVAYGHREVHVHPSGTRRLSVYEAMLLQGFPPTYELLGTLSAQIQQVSDAVPPPLAAAIARSLHILLAGSAYDRVEC